MPRNRTHDQEPDVNQLLTATPSTPGATPEVRRMQQRLEPPLALLTDYLDLLMRSTGIGGGGLFLHAKRVLPELWRTNEHVFSHLRFMGTACVCVVAVEARKQFCRMVNGTDEGQRRCDQCEREAAHACSRTRQQRVYQCHAGLTDTATPVLIGGSYAGMLCVGQFLRAEVSPTTFEGVWERVKDIPGLERERLLAVFDEIPVLSEAAVGEAMVRVQKAAAAFTRSWEGMLELVSEEKELSRLHFYRARELAEMLLQQEPVAAKDIAARARLIGLADPPTAVLVAQPDSAAIETLRMSSEEREQEMAQLVAAAHECERGLSNILVTSVRAGEVLILMSPRAVRNRELRRVELDELKQTLLAHCRGRVKAPVLVGVGADTGPSGQLAAAYREARGNMWLSAGRFEARRPPEVTNNARLLTALSPAHDGPRQENPLLAWCLEALRTVGYASDESIESGHRLFENTLEMILEPLERQGVPREQCAALRDRYLQDRRTLAGYADLAAWFQAHVLPCVDAATAGPATAGARIAREACTFVADGDKGLLRRGDAAENAGLSEAHFGRVFREAAGVSFREYLVTLRIAQAQELLRNPERAISDVAAEVGYSDPAAFSRAFSRVCGVSPTGYRRNPNVYPRLRPEPPTR